MTATTTLGTTSATTTTTPTTLTAEGEAASARRHAVVPTAVGELTLVAEGDDLVGIYFREHHPAPDRSRFGAPVDPEDDAVLARAARQLVEFATGERAGFDLPLRPVGSDRARQVWDLVAAVPRGSTTTYAALGRALGIGPRVAGQLVARNPLCVVLPCHRVVASDGRLTGYAGGVDVKRALLQLEGVLGEGATVVPKGAPVTAAASEEVS